MNRRKFIQTLSSVALAGLCQFGYSQPKSGGKIPKVITADGKLSKRTYRKIKNIRIPIKNTVVIFNTKRGQWESKIVKSGFLKPILNKQRRLVWV